MDKNYLKFSINPSKPKFTMPDGAIDAHCHVFGDRANFPYHPTRKYTPCDAPKDKLFALRDHLGISRNIIVQASCHGSDNSALIDALITAGDLARGVAVVKPIISDDKLKLMHDNGIRAVRFNFVKRLVDVTPPEVFLNIANRIKKLGWHIVVYFESDDLKDIIPFLRQLDCLIVIDHMGRPDVTKGVNHKDFQSFISFMEDNENIWVKVTCPERLTAQLPQNGILPNYSDVIPFAKSLVEKFPDRVLWGTDWPHPNMKSHMPDDGQLVDIIPQIATNKILQQKLLIDNPYSLYWGDDKTGLN